jgi:drug/metabolite transporter (DMT)-like permease
MVVLASLAAALAYALAAVLQQHAAVEQPHEDNLRPRLLLRLARRPLWLAGIAASAMGLLLQLLALSRGALVVVQPILVLGLVFALAINALVLHRRRLAPSEAIAALTVCTGLVLFLETADPRQGRASAGAGDWLLVLAGTLAAMAVLLGPSLVTRGPVRAALQATAGGVANGLSAAFTKGLASRAEHAAAQGLGALAWVLLSSWQTYALATSLVVVMLLVQSAFQSGPIRWSLPALTAANPVASVAIGAGVLGERLRPGALAGAGEVGGLLLVVAGVLALSSSRLITGGDAIARAPVPPPPRPAEGSRHVRLLSDAAPRAGRGAPRA